MVASGDPEPGYRHDTVSQTDFSWHQLFKRWIALSTGQTTIQWITRLVFVILIHWISIYPVDSAIQLLNNWGQKFSSVCGTSYIIEV